MTEHGSDRLDAVIAEGFLSADCHVFEPRDLFRRRMQKKFRDRAPGMISKSDSDYYVCDGLPDQPIGIEASGMDVKINDRIRHAVGYRWEDMRPGSYDMAARKEDMKLDNLVGELLSPSSLAINFHALNDAEYACDACRVYNSWLAEFVQGSDGASKGAAVIPVKCDVGASIAEAMRSRENGHAILCLPIDPHVPYSDPLWSPLWDAISEIELPVSLHAGTSSAKSSAELLDGFGAAFGRGLTWCRMASGVMTTADILWGGLADKWPKLRWVLAETGFGWIPGLIEFMDSFWEDNRLWIEPKIEMKPSEQFKHAWYATFEEESTSMALRHEVGVDRLLWGSDYPHTEGTFPNSRDTVRRIFAGVPADEVKKMVSTNAASLFGFDAQSGSRWTGDQRHAV